VLHKLLKGGKRLDAQFEINKYRLPGKILNNVIEELLVITSTTALLFDDVASRIRIATK